MGRGRSQRAGVLFNRTHLDPTTAKRTGKLRRLAQWLGSRK